MDGRIVMHGLISMAQDAYSDSLAPDDVPILFMSDLAPHVKATREFELYARDILLMVNHMMYGRDEYLDSEELELATNLKEWMERN